MMNLYSMVKHDSSARVRWLLSELNIPYNDIHLSYRNGDLKSPEFLAKHPLGQVPVLEIEGVSLFESYAIVAYLADKHIEKGLAPQPTDVESRREYYQWLFFSCNSVEDFFSRYFQISKMSPEYLEQWGEYVRAKTNMILAFIEKHLLGRETILDQFSAVDICVTYALDMISEESFFSDYPLTKSYYERMKSRPACMRAEVFKALVKGD